MLPTYRFHVYYTAGTLIYTDCFSTLYFTFCRFYTLSFHFLKLGLVNQDLETESEYINNIFANLSPKN